jgi:hypothetical protein
LKSTIYCIDTNSKTAYHRSARFTEELPGCG